MKLFLPIHNPAASTLTFDIQPTTLLTPAKDAQLGKLCPQHVRDPTGPAMPYQLAHD